MPNYDERQTKALVKIAGNTDEFVKALTALNENIVKVGKLFQAWIDTPEVESVLNTDTFIEGYQGQEESERMVGDKFVVTDSSSDFFNMHGEIVEVFPNSSVLAKLKGIKNNVPLFLNQVCILTEDKELGITVERSRNSGPELGYN